MDTAPSAIPAAIRRTAPRLSLEAITLIYLVSYVPYIVITRWLATTVSATLGRPLSGLDILPGLLILSSVQVALFVWATGWWKAAHSFRLGPLTLPRPTRWTLASGMCMALVLFSVPLSFTFKGVSIPFIQLLMRGDLLIVAPLVDMLAGRKVRWFSWTALALAAVGIACTLRARGGFYLPPLAILTVIFYTVGCFIRLFIMTRIAKTEDPAVMRGYFVEEQMIANPVALIVLGLLCASGMGGDKHTLSFAFLGVWTSDQFPWIALLSVLVFMAAVLSATIVLDKRENTYCIPLERSASILAGIIATYWLALQFHQPKPTAAELFGAAALIVAILVLSLGPRATPSLEARSET